MVNSAPFQGISNFRDFGGFSLLGGGYVRTGRLLRSAHLGEATDADLERLAQAPLSVLVDLRRPTERMKQPNRLPAGYSGLVIESDDGDLGESPHMTLMRRNPTPEAVEAYLLDYYRTAYFLPRHRSLFSRTLKALETAPGAVLIHCAAGKDRTGLLAALIRAALGGRAEDTSADFLATNAATLTEARIADAQSKLAALVGADPHPAVIQAFLGVWPHHLDAAFASLEERYGSTEGYLDSLGCDAAARARLADALAA